jgi:hypothetical protein
MKLNLKKERLKAIQDINAISPKYRRTLENIADKARLLLKKYNVHYCRGKS